MFENMLSIHTQPNAAMYLFGVTLLAEDEWEKDWVSTGTLPILKHSERPLISLQINNHTK